MKRVVCFFVLFVFLIGFVFSVFGADSYTQSGPTIYINDSPWGKASTYFPHIIDGICYVAVSVFEAFDGYKVSYFNSKTGCLIEDTNSERYISFDTRYDDNNHLAMTYDKSGISVKVRKYYGDFYVPLDIVAETMKLSFTVFVSENDSNVFTLRICNGSQKKTMEELLKEYDPGMLKTPETTAPDTEPRETDRIPDDTTPVDPDDEPGEDVDRVSRTVYLTFEDCPNEYTDEILDLLDLYEYKAAFFLVGNNIAEYTDVVIRMAASGHSVGLHTMTGDERKFDDIDKFIYELEKENELLMRILKQKSHLVRAPEGSSTNAFYIDKDEKELIESNGFVIWDWNVDALDNGMYWYRNVSLRVIENLPLLVKPVVRFRSNQVTLDALPEILDFIQAHENYTVKAIAASDPEINFAGIYD